MSRRSSVFTRVAMVASASALLTGCGEEEASIVESAFENDVRSAQVSLRVELKEGDRPAMAVALEGPMRSNGAGKLESFDWRVRGEGAAKEVTTRIISSGRNVFVEYKGQTYEVGEKEIAELQKGDRSAKKDGEIEDLQDAERLGLDLQSWFPKSDAEQDSEVAGEATRRATGRLDLSAALKDLRRLASNPALGSDPALKPLAEISPAEIKMVDQLVTDPRFALDVADEDGKLRRIATTMSLRAAKDAPRQSLRFVMEYRNVDQPVRIQAPSSGKPIEQLFERLGDTGVQPETEVVN